MKILHVIASLNPASGGVSVAVKTMIGAVESKEIKNEVITLDSPTASFIKDLAFPVYCLGPAKSGWAYSSFLKPWLTQNLLKYHSVIIHGLWQFPDYAVRKCIDKYRKEKKENVPKVYLMPHGMLDPYFQLASSRKLKALRNFFYWKIIEGKNVSNADGLLFTCEEELLLARKSFQPYFPNKEINVGLGVNPPPDYMESMSTAFRRKCNIAAGAKFILFISRIHEKKGVDLLIDAYLTKYNYFEQIKNGNSTKSPPPYLVIAGPGLETDYGKQIMRVALKAANFIVFPGMLSGDEKWGAFYECDAFILPSHQENFGIAVVEALACGKPVLISNKINIWREISEQGAGIVKEDTGQGIVELLEAWEQLTEDERKVMREKSKAAYEKTFSIDKVSGKLLEALESEAESK